MFNFLNRRKKHITECVVLYSFQFDRNRTIDLFNFLIAYFKSSCDVEFKYAGFYNESYNDKYDNIEKISPVLFNSKLNEIVNFSLDVSDLRKRERTIGVEFEITRPVHLMLFFPENFAFDLGDFLYKINLYFPIGYGFCYKTTESYWITSYGIGDFSHSKGIVGINSLQEKDFERWRSNCEKFTNGLFRNIYNVNILNRAHLENQVKGEKLENYILKNDIGSLTFIDSNISLWVLDDKQVRFARKEVSKSGNLV